MKRHRLLYIIVGAIVVVVLAIGIGIFVLLPSITSANTSATTTPTPTVTATTTPTHKGNGVAKIVRQYAPSMKTLIAQGLKLTPIQLTTDLKSGKTLSQIATAKNVSASQLQTILNNAVQSSLAPAVSAGTLTQQQVNSVVKRFEKNPTQLDKLLMNAKTTTN